MRDFFGHQESALARSARLIVLLAIALGGTVLLTAAGMGYIAAVLAHLQTDASSPATAFAVVTGVAIPIVAVTVGIVSLLKMHELSAGGHVIATQLGATLIVEGTQDPNHRKVLNIVQEIAIAANIPVPPVYVMENELGINALAAGYSPSEAVIAVTRGCLDRLARDQLQGVIAHEFSHIINGDMQLNVRAIGVLHGILAIPVLAEAMIEHGWKAVSEPPANGRDATLGGLLTILVGIVLWLIGSAGLFLSLLIKSAINRQREFLADASAVEYTRHPEGLAGALKVIAGYAPGGRVRSPFALEASHLFFAEGVRGWGQYLRSHPPLSQRILRLEPNWDGIPLFEEEQHVGAYDGAFAGTMQLIGVPMATNSQTADWQAPSHDVPPTDLATVDAIENQWSPSAEDTTDLLPSGLRELSKSVRGARIGLLASWGVHFDQVDSLATMPAIEVACRPATHSTARLLASLTDEQQVVFFDQLLDGIGHLSCSELTSLTTLFADIESKYPSRDLKSWIWYRLLHSVMHQQMSREPSRPRYGNIEQIRNDVQFFVSAVASAGDASGPMIEYAFHRACSQLSLRTELTFLDFSRVTFDQLDEPLRIAFENCALLSPGPRRNLMLACGACVTGDRQVTCTEAMMIRLVCSTLNYPRSSLLPGQAVTPGA